MTGLKITALALATVLAWTYPAYAAPGHEDDHHGMDNGHHDNDAGHHQGEGHDDHHGDGHHEGGDDHHGNRGHHDGHDGAEGHGDDQHSFWFGEPGDPSDVDRTVKIVATDNDFDHETIAVTAGETVRFVLENKGQLVHEFTIGPPHMQKAHQREMTKMMERGDMTATSVNGGMKHAHANSVLLEPGETKEIIWTFSKEADVHFACNIPGHYEAGMHGEFKFGET